MRYPFLFITLLICATSAHAQELTESQLRVARDQFVSDVARVAPPEAVLPFQKGGETRIVGRDGEHGLALIRSGSEIALFDAKENKFIAFWTEGTSANRAVKLQRSSNWYILSPGGNRIAQRNSDGTDIYDREKLVASLPGILVIDFINDNEVIAESKSEKKYFVWSISGNRMKVKLPGNNWAYLNPARTKLSISEADKTSIFDIATGKIISKIPGANTKWFSNGMVVGGGYPPSFIDVEKNVKIKLDGVYALEADLTLVTGNSVVRRNGNNLSFYDTEKQKVINDQPVFLPNATSSFEFMAIADPPGLLAVARDDGPQGVYVYADRMATSSAVIAYADGTVKPLLWHTPKTTEEKIAMNEQERQYFAQAAAEVRREREVAMQRSLAKYKDKECAETFLPLELQKIDSGTVVTYNGELFFFRHARCSEGEIVLHGKGSQNSWGLSTKKISSLYVNDIRRSDEPFYVCRRCDGSGVLTYTGGKVYKQELPSFYKPGYTVTRYYQSQQQTYEMCPVCKGKGAE